MAGVLRDLPRDARLLLGGVAVDALGTGLVLPFLVVYLHDVRSLGLATVGALAAIPAVVALCLLAPIGALIDVVGPRRVQAGSLVARCVGTTLLAFATSPGQAAGALALVGVGHAAFWPASQSLVAVRVPSATRPRFFGLSFTLVNAGIGVGGVLGALWVDVARPGTFTAVYLLDAASSLAPLALLLGPLRHVGNAAPRRVAATAGGSYRAVLGDPPFRRTLLLVVLTTFVGYGMLEAGFTAYARTVAEASTRVIGFAFAANTATIVLAQLAVLRWISGRRRTRVLVVLAGVWAAAWLLMGASAAAGPAVAAVLLVLSLAVFGLGETLLSPVAPAITNDLASDTLRGRYNATAALAFQVGAIAAPVAAGLLLGARRSGEFVTMVLVGCAAVAVVALRLERHLPPVANGLRPAPDPVTASAADPLPGGAGHARS